MVTVVAQSVEHWTRYSKVVSWVPAHDKLSFRPLFLLQIYITISTNNIPYTFHDITVH